MKKDEYYKLSQLNRIEYLLRKKENTFDFQIFSFVGAIINLVFWYLLFAILLLGFWKNTTLFSYASVLAFLIRLGIIFIVIADILGIILYFYKKDKLEKEFKERGKNGK